MASAATESRKTRARKSGTAEQWVKLGTHVLACPSGFTPTIRYPDLSRMMKNDTVPERLRAFALKQAFGELETEPVPESPEKDVERFEIAKEMAVWHDFLLMEMVTDPKLTPELLEQIPAEDRDFLVSVALRERDTDALGATLGVDPLSRWERFRSFHECPESCPACEKVRQEFSSVELG